MDQLAGTALTDSPTSSGFNMTAMAFQWSDGTNVVTSPDITVTSTPTRYSYTFTTPATVAADSYVAVIDAASDPSGNITVTDIELNVGSTPNPYTGSTPGSAPPGGGGLINIINNSPASGSSFLRHYLGFLVPDSTKLAASHTNHELFEQFVPYPVTLPEYIAPVLDGGFTSTFAAAILLSATPGRGISGPAIVHSSLDSWNDGAADTSVFTPWTTGNATGRFFRAKVTMDTTVPSYISALTLNLTSQSITKYVNEFAVGIAGTVLNFPNVFHSPPNIQITPSDGTSTSGGASTITSNSAMIELFRGETQVAGVCNITLVG